MKTELTCFRYRSFNVTTHFVEGNEECVGNWPDICDSVRRHGSTTSIARSSDRERVQAVDVGTHEGTGRGAVGRQLKTETFGRLERRQKRTRHSRSDFGKATKDNIIASQLLLRRKEVSKIRQKQRPKHFIAIFNIIISSGQQNSIGVRMSW